MTRQEFEYKEGEDYEERDGMWYWIDPEHQGHIQIFDLLNSL